MTTRNKKKHGICEVGRVGEIQLKLSKVERPTKHIIGHIGDKVLRVK